MLVTIQRLKKFWSGLSQFYEGKFITHSTTTRHLLALLAKLPFESFVVNVNRQEIFWMEEMGPSCAIQITRLRVVMLLLSDIYIYCKWDSE